MIVIINYNGAKYQNDCIKSIKAMDYDNLFTVVVDSNSSDNSIELLKRDYEDVIVLQQLDNCGVAKGNNIGIKYCLEKNADYIMLLNNDVVLDKELMIALLAEADEKTVTVPKIYYYEPNNVIWYAGGEINWKKGDTIHYGINDMDSMEFDTEQNVNYAPTCCMLINSKVFGKVGFMDEKVFMYYDDTDFCVRLIENEIGIKYVPRAKMWHKVSSSVGGQNSKLQVYYMVRNGLYFRHKYKKKFGILSQVYVNMKNIIKFIIHPFRCPNNVMIIEGYKDYFRGRMGRKEFK